MSKPKGNIIYRWKNPHPRKYRILNNEAEEYIVIEDKEAVSGVVIYGKFNKEWTCGPWSANPLVRQLQAELEETKEYLRLRDENIEMLKGNVK